MSGGSSESIPAAVRSPCQASHRVQARRIRSISASFGPIGRLYPRGREHRPPIVDGSVSQDLLELHKNLPLPIAHLLGTDPEEATLFGGFGGVLGRLEDPSPIPGRLLRRRLLGDNSVRFPQLVQDQLTRIGARLRFQIRHGVLLLLQSHLQTGRQVDNQTLLIRGGHSCLHRRHGFFRHLDGASDVGQRNSHACDQRGSVELDPLLFGEIGLVGHVHPFSIGCSRLYAGPPNREGAPHRALLRLANTSRSLRATR